MVVSPYVVHHGLYLVDPLDGGPLEQALASHCTTSAKVGRRALVKCHNCYSNAEMSTSSAPNTQDGRKVIEHRCQTCHWGTSVAQCKPLRDRTRKKVERQQAEASKRKKEEAQTAVDAMHGS